MNDDATVRPLHGTHRALQPVVGGPGVLLVAALAQGLLPAATTTKLRSPARRRPPPRWPAGGTLTGPDGVELVVPPGALSADTELRITKTGAGAPALQADGSVVTPTYEFTPHRAAARAAGDDPHALPAAGGCGGGRRADGQPQRRMGRGRRHGRRRQGRMAAHLAVLRRGDGLRGPGAQPRPYACVW